MAIFGKRLHMALDLAGVPRKPQERYEALSARYAISRQQAYRWCSGSAIPNPAQLKFVAQDLGHSLDFLLGLTTEAAEPNDDYIPYYTLVDADVEAVASNFSTSNGIYLKHATGFDLEQSSHCIVRAWFGSKSPVIRAGDAMLVSQRVTQLEPGMSYLLRSASTTVLRKVVAAADMVTLERSDERGAHSTHHAFSEFTTDNSDFTCEWPRDGFLVLGRVDAILQRCVGGSSF